jgi:glycosyltransferase involved in cell wall biosynthesis
VRIVWDVSPLSHALTGVGKYHRGSLAAVAEAAGGEHEIVAFAPTSPQGLRAIPRALEGVPVELSLVFLPFAHHWRTAWSRLGRPALERFLGRFDVLHFTDWMYPPQRAGVRSTMIHDLVPLRFPEWTTRRTRSMHGAKYRNAASTCDVIFTNSRYTADDVRHRLGVAEERLRVAPPGVDRVFRAEGERADVGRPYVLTVATLEPRKNLGTLVAAHRLLGGEHALAVAGGEGWGEQPDLDVPGVLRLGFVPDERLATLYREAAAFVFPSRFEGFGIPIVEAMACGTPVVASSHPSLDEACGDAAVRADPESPEALAAAIERAVRERDELARRGLEHARRFTWERVGRTFLEGFSEAAA